MLDSERDKLNHYEHKYLSIGITEGGVPRMSGFVPWDGTCNAFNMRTPNIYFEEEDFQDPEILEALSRFCVFGCYIFTPLKNYDFLAQFTEIEDLFIRYGSAIRDLSFVRNMEELFMLYLEDAHLPDLEPLFPEGRKYRMANRCLGFYHCQVDDIRALVDSKVYLSELKIWPEKGDPEDKKRWKAARCGRFRYCEEKE